MSREVVQGRWPHSDPPRRCLTCPKDVRKVQKLSAPSRKIYISQPTPEVLFPFPPREGEPSLDPQPGCPASRSWDWCHPTCFPAIPHQALAAAACCRVYLGDKAWDLPDRRRPRRSSHFTVGAALPDQPSGPGMLRALLGCFHTRLFVIQKISR